MPYLTDVQEYAAAILRKLRCMRHDQMHRMIHRRYTQVDPRKTMHRLCNILQIRNDGGHYCWPWCEVNADRIAAIDVMLEICGNNEPVFDIDVLPCAILFFVFGEKKDNIRAFRVYIPQKGKSGECFAAAESTRLPEGHIAVFIIRDKKQMQRLKTSRPHIFAIADSNGKYQFFS